MMKNEKPLLIYVAGPTAVGKTATAIALAKWLNTEIVSCDSRQFFKELNIGTAPPSEKELAEVPHHFIQHTTIEKPYNAGSFTKDAMMKLDELFARHKTVILVGGSGLYADALLFGLDDLPKADEDLRTYLAHELSTKGIEHLQKRLKKLDPDYFEQVDIANPHRVMRALEVIETTGKTFSQLRLGLPAERPFRYLILALEIPREELYARINKRVDQMVDAGLEDEARQLFDKASLPALNTVGYKEWFAHFRGEISREAAIDLIKQNTRRFAKRQLTWLRRYPDAYWFAPADISGMLNIIHEHID